MKQISTVNDHSVQCDRTAPFTKMNWIPAGSFQMGSNNHYPEEGPVHLEKVESFWIDQFAVTNEEFSRFADETNHVTVAERAPKAEDYPGAKPELLVPASVVFVKPKIRVDVSNIYNWWTYIPGANWRHPEGPESSIANRAQHPVVHLAYEDAEAYAKWIGKEIPTEAEWEYAARGGLDQATYAWGEELTPNGKHMANTWQGEFPWQNLGGDGFERTAPVGKFPANGYGLYDMIGNVWEWTTSWFSSRHAVVNTCCGAVSQKANRDESYDPQMQIKIPRRVIKGGSFLCAPNYCQRYRPAARMAQPVDTATCHVGLRLIVRDRGAR